MTDPPATTRYPVTGPRSFIDCPVHDLAVSLDLEGWINSSCPECVREAESREGFTAADAASKETVEGQRAKPDPDPRQSPDGDSETEVGRDIHAGTPCV